MSSFLAGVYVGKCRKMSQSVYETPWREEPLVRTARRLEPSCNGQDINLWGGESIQDPQLVRCFGGSGLGGTF